MHLSVSLKEADLLEACAEELPWVFDKSSKLSFFKLSAFHILLAKNDMGGSCWIAHKLVVSPNTRIATTSSLV